MVGERKARKTEAWRVVVEAIWRTRPRRGLAMNSVRLGVMVGGELSCVMDCVSRLATESRRRESAADVFLKRPAWLVASASPKPPMKRWRAEVSAMSLDRESAG